MTPALLAAVFTAAGVVAIAIAVALIAVEPDFVDDDPFGD